MIFRTSGWYSSWVVEWLLDTPNFWYLPHFACPLIFFTMASMIFVSILTYVAISVERYVAIVHPMKMVAGRSILSSRGHSVIIILAIWVFNAGYHAPNYLMTNTYLENNGSKWG